MRVISGTNRGLKLDTLKGENTRPTEDRIKENVFNLLGQNFYNTNVLDLFSGSGSIGIEFLSRGAEKSYFVDNSLEAINVIKKNVKKAKLEDKSLIFKSDALTFLMKYSDEKFDYIYLDPPYKNVNLYLKVVEYISKKNILKDTGYIVIEQDSSISLNIEDYLKIVKSKKYGNTSIGVWQLK
ncbi:16S rRNA (guanine(966)-N(2))-methyltransferase RsmD [Anaerosphaera aminiphila DSM 21120]|uniref:16S rRNA (Guanine(966)-N(2))-methyltransferase RsmD n=1 Tax=Anaerosphaera aminiphila DSM 21120 TaxID=1120995 RepID=A0A1M5P3C7_9FIRM|nr:16S rRNA (guanine(966)-N(2))-methyltransferase RsmD [Anaerosphaera aminiphila]SHG96225.1 16S rRNA (guanine(966)-N(2))-methyltransferase RsmD [Anaerosphaera aminiphila DSM 21120]